MAIRGENIGSAYVRVLADGSTFDESVRQQMDEIDWDKFGRKAEEKWLEGWEEEASKKANQRTLREAISKPLAKGDWLTQSFFRGTNWSRFRGGLFNEFGEAGKRAADNLETSLLEGMTFSGLSSRLDNIIPDVVRAQKQIDKELQTAQLESQREQEKNLNNWFKNQLQGWERYNQAVIKQNQDYDKRLELHWRSLERLSEQRADATREVENEFRNYTRLLDKMVKGETTALRKNELAERFEELGDRMRSVNDEHADFIRNLEVQQNRLNRLHPTLDRTNFLIGKFADQTGTMFGRGSRNNFLNVIGGMARGMVGLLGVVPRVIKGFLEVGSAFTGAFKEVRQTGGGIFNLLSAGFSGVGAAALKAGPALIGFAAIAAGMALVLGPLIGIMSMLAGIVTALAASLTFALAGALGAVAAVVLPGVAALSTMAGAWMALSDAQKEALKADFQPVTRAFRELGEVAGRGIFDRMGDQARRLAPVIEGLRGMFRRVGDAIGDVNESFLTSLEGPGFQAWRDAFEDFLPGAVRTLGDVVKNTLGGFGGIFRGMIPFMERTLEWLDKITTRFTEWANSAKGQNQIKQFFEDAGDSAASVGGFLESILGFISEIFDKGRQTGDNIFDKMARSIEDATTWLEKNPDALSDWFEDAEKFSEDIGELVTKLTALIDLLDNPKTRAAGRGLFTGLTIGLGFTIGPLAIATDLFSRMWKRAQVAGVAVSAAFGVMGSAAGRVRDRIGDVFGSLGGMIMRRISGIPDRFRDLISRLPQPAQNAINRIVGFFQNLPGRVTGAIQSIPSRFTNAVNNLPGIAGNFIGRVVSNFATLPGRFANAVASIPSRFTGVINGLPGIAAGIVTRIVNFFQGLPGRIESAIGNLGSMAGQVFGQMVSAVAGIPGQIVGMFSGLAGQILSAIGTIDLGSLIRMPERGGGVPYVPGMASGGIVSGANLRLIGEAGPEAVVPLNRNLAQVDPAVRWLSAIAQGKAPAMARGGVVGAGKTVNVEMNVYSPQADPRAVAVEAMNHLVAVGY